MEARDERAVICVCAEYNADETRLFFEIPEAIVRIYQPPDDPRTFAQCLADMAAKS